MGVAPAADAASSLLHSDDMRADHHQDASLTLDELRRLAGDAQMRAREIRHAAAAFVSEARAVRGRSRRLRQRLRGERRGHGSDETGGPEP